MACRGCVAPHGFRVWQCMPARTEFSALIGVKRESAYGHPPVAEIAPIIQTSQYLIAEIRRNFLVAALWPQLYQDFVIRKIFVTDRNAIHTIRSAAIQMDFADVFDIFGFHSHQ